MTDEITNNQDIIDSRDVIARIEELESERDSVSCDLASAEQELEAARAAASTHPEDEDVIAEMQDREADRDSAHDELVQWDEDYAAELKALKDFEAEGNSEWRHGETLIRESYFKNYAQELAEDIGAINTDTAGWPNRCIDWDQAADELQMDYTSADFDGVTYYYRS